MRWAAALLVWLTCTSVFLATIPNEGPTGQFFFEKNTLPW